MISVKEQKEEIIHSALDTIKQYLSEYVEIGIFGSVARGSYSASSDVDIYLITKKKVDKHLKAELAADLNDLGVDIVFLTKADLLQHSDHLLIKNIVRDRKIIESVESSHDFGGKIL